MTNTEGPQNYVRFADESMRLLPAGLASKVVGLDSDGCLLVPLMGEDLDYLIPLTPCCNASGKGGGHGVVCRSCYRDVDPKFGGRERLFVAVVR